MKYNPQKHHRRSIRLKGYDYSQAGLYFITICTQNRAHLFGEIADGEMILNDPGKMITKWYYELENKFPDIQCHEMIIMPNHFHCIIENVGADLRVCPKTCPKTDIPNGNNNIPNGNNNVPNGNNDVPNGNNGVANGNNGVANGNIIPNGNIEGEHKGSPLSEIIQWFKTMTTNEYIRGVKSLNWQRFDGKLWQRNYWEHIIRNDMAYQRIAEYIINNPKNWKNDKLKT